MTYPSLYCFNSEGLSVFDDAFGDRLVGHQIEPLNRDLVSPIVGTGAFVPATYASAKSMAQSIISALGHEKVREHLSNCGLWAWLTFVLKEQLFKRDIYGQWKFGERSRWYPSDPNDWRKSQRHLVRMPVHLLHSFGDSADHLLCGSPNAMTEIREQLTSQRDMFSPVFLQVGRRLYFDSAKGGLRRGAGRKVGGTPRRLARLRQQLDVAWDLDDLTPDEIISMLPSEFDQFKGTPSD